MAKLNRGLGLGLDALLKVNVIDNNEDPQNNNNEKRVLAGFTELPIDKIRPNPNQPRKNFSEESIQNLSQSIKSVGLIQPITVVKVDDYFEIVAGERRYRAAKLLGLEKIPVIIKDLSQKSRMELSLVENIQRENLNPIEEALAYSNIITNYNITHEELAETLGKSRSSITNTLRLLNLDIQIQKWIIENKLSQGHARAILSCENSSEQLNLARYIIENQLSVRESEEISKKWPIKQEKKVTKNNKVREIELENIEKELERKLQTKVNIIGSSFKGKIQIEYFNTEDLERILELFKVY